MDTIILRFYHQPCSVEVKTKIFLLYFGKLKSNYNKSNILTQEAFDDDPFFDPLMLKTRSLLLSLACSSTNCVQFNPHALILMTPIFCGKPIPSASIIPTGTSVQVILPTTKKPVFVEETIIHNSVI